MRPLLPFATLLGTAFLLGCQEQASSPVEPEGPQFDRPGFGNCDAAGSGGHCHDDDEPVDDPLIATGEDLFFNATFGGNGRTCGTCHRAENNLTIDVEFIDGLSGDPLFLAETDPSNLPPFDPKNPLVPAFEAPDLMRARGLILENIGGFDLDGSGNLLTLPVFRAPPSLFNLAFTAPYGYSGNVPNLRAFVVGAIEQHFTKTLARTAGTDFLLPTEDELDALEAFMLSLQSPEDGNFRLPRGSRRRPEVRGRVAFGNVGCGSCHVGTVLSGGNNATGVEDLMINDDLPLDIGAGNVANPSFQTPGLFGLRKAAFFHNNSAVGLQAAVEFYVSPEFQASPTGGQVDPNMSAAQIQDIVAFLVAISQE